MAVGKFVPYTVRVTPWPATAYAGALGTTAVTRTAPGGRAAPEGPAEGAADADAPAEGTADADAEGAADAPAEGVGVAEAPKDGSGATDTEEGSALSVMETVIVGLEVCHL